MDVDRLAEIALELACRVREYDPIDNGRWLQAVTSVDDRWCLLFVMAGAIPIDVPWGQLVGWTDLPYHANELVAERFGRAA
jgi:hypothetical protein